jgi:hypothetical protein
MPLLNYIDRSCTKLLFESPQNEKQSIERLSLLHRNRPHMPRVQAASGAVQVSVRQAGQDGCSYERACRWLGAGAA